MNIELNNFKYWLNTGIGKINNREIIYEYYFKLINLISSLGLKTPNIKLKHEFIAYLYEHSKFSKIKTQIFKTYELPNDEFIVNYEYYFIDFFNNMKNNLDPINFNILDSNLKNQKINFISLIEIIYNYPILKKNLHSLNICIHLKKT